jgi:hypothetical protein
MSYGHAERNLALIRQLEAETRQLFGSLAQQGEQEQLSEPRQSGEPGGSPRHYAEMIVGTPASRVRRIPASR